MTYHYSSPWTDERVELLKAMWPHGWSAGDIAAKLDCGLTRNAVIGKVHRLGLPVHKTISVRKSRGPRKRKPARPLMTTGPALTAEQIEADKLPPNQSPCAVTFMQLTYRHCRFPIERDGKPMMYCGAEHVEGSSWCPRHWKIVYQPPPARKPQSYYPTGGKQAA